MFSVGRQRLLWVGAISLSCLTAFAQSDLPVPPREGEDFKEAQVPLPPYPKAERLMRFPTDWTRHEIFLDPDGLSVDADGVVRFSLVLRSPSGAETVSYEGIRCETGEKQIYAFGRRSTAGETSWSAARSPGWRSISDTVANRYYFEFRRDLFCDHKVPEPKGVILSNIPRGGRERRNSLNAE